MGKTWKDKPRNVEAKELWTPKYHKRVIPTKRPSPPEAKDIINEEYIEDEIEREEAFWESMNWDA